jgi:hypothetical protein
MDNDFDPENVDAFEDGTAAVLRDLGGGLGPDATLAAANKSKLRRPAILDDPVYRGKVISAKEVLRRGEASEEEDSAEEDDELEEASDDSSEEEESGDGSAAAASAPSRGTDAISAQLGDLALRAVRRHARAAQRGLLRGESLGRALAIVGAGSVATRHLFAQQRHVAAQLYDCSVTLVDQRVALVDQLQVVLEVFRQNLMLLR